MSPSHLYLVVAVALAELVEGVEHAVEDGLAPEEVREAADQLGEEGVRVLADRLVGDGIFTCDVNLVFMYLTI